MRSLISTAFLRFILVGLASTAVDLAVVYCAAMIISGYWIPVTAGFLTGLIVNFLAHAKFTFRTESVNSHQAMRFLSVVVLNYFLTLAIVASAEYLFNASVIAGKILSLPCVAVVGFTLSKIWVFQTKLQSSTSQEL